MTEYRPGERPVRSQKWWKKGKPGKLKSSMVGLSTAAVLGVYAAGYIASDGAASGGDVFAAEPQATEAATSATAAPATATAVVPSSRPSGGSRTAPGAAPTTAATATPQATTQATAAAYRDGVFTGSGTGPHGGLTVAVTVAAGKITSVEITSCQTRYPCSRIAAMPAKIVAAQSTNVTYVSRATDSSVAFVRAVTAALATAQA